MLFNKQYRWRKKLHNLEKILFNVTISHKKNEKISRFTLSCNDFFNNADKNVFLDTENQIRRPIRVCFG